MYRVGENNIGAPKIQNNIWCTLPILAIAIEREVQYCYHNIGNRNNYIAPIVFSPVDEI